MCVCASFLLLYLCGEHRSIVYVFIYLILILWSFNLNPNISLKTPDNADNMTTLIVVYKYGFALRPDILNGDSNSCNKKKIRQKFSEFKSKISKNVKFSP